MTTQPDTTKHCLKCRYNLTGLPQPRCPECGISFDLDDPLTYYTKFSLRVPIAKILRYAALLFIAAAPITILTLASPIFPESPNDLIRFRCTAKPNPLARILTKYHFDTGRLPNTNEAWQVLFTPPADDTGEWRGPYITDRKLLNDAWGTPYRYRSPGTHNKNGYDLWSAGPDQRDNTPDDIKNWRNP